MKALRISAAILTASLALVATLFFSSRVGADQDVDAVRAPTGTDLYMDWFELDPPSPKLGEAITLTFQACNASDSTEVAGRRIYLYVDPGDQPPISTTVATARFIAGIVWPAGDCQWMQYANYSKLGQSGRHVAYAWVDPLERIAETNETNNLLQITFDVDPEIPAGQQDVYEEDDVCGDANVISTDGAVQLHKFDPAGDVDWVKFSATAGTVYTLTATGTGEEAHPVFEIWDTCGEPPDTFGGTSFKLRFEAPTSKDYYLRLNNEIDAENVDESIYRVTVHSNADIAGVQPTVTSIDPTSGYNDRNTNAEIKGADFDASATVALCPYENNACGDCTHELEFPQWLASDTLIAVIPPNLPYGNYCLAVTNPGGKVGMLENAFEVLPGQPDLRDIRPGQGYNNAPTNVDVYGFNFHPGISVMLGDTGLGNVEVVNPTKLRGTVPANLTPGVYALQAFYGTGEPDILPDAFTVQQSGDDLFAQADELWFDPVAPRVGGSARTGVTVHRQGGSAALFDIKVRFFANDQLIGDTYVPLLSPGAAESTRRLEWVPTQSGDNVIRAEIDPDNQITEINEANNVVTRTVKVLQGIPPGMDYDAPEVTSLTIKDSPAAVEGVETVSDTLIYLTVTTTDTGGSGVGYVRYVELEYNEGAKIWIPVQDSGWKDNVPEYATNYRWLLTPVGGLHYIQAWAKDRAGNVSHFPYQQKINYLPDADWVDEAQTDTYWQTVDAGQTLSVTVTPAGPGDDPDLAIFPPNWEETEWYSSTQEGNAVEHLAIVAQVSGIYIIEVYGHTATQYDIDIHVGSTVRRLATVSPAEVNYRQWPRDEPLVPGEPPLDVDPSEAEKLYLPLVIRQ